MKNIVLSCNHPILIAGFRTIIEASDDYSLSVCEDRGLIRECTLARNADIVLADVADGITLDILTGLRASSPESAIILWVDSISTEFISQAVSAGIRGVLRKNADVEMYLQCLREVAAGGFWIDVELSKKLLGTRIVKLTRRERQLSLLLARGLRNKELAYQLGITVGTVKVYLSRLYTKVGMADRFELALFALKNLGADQTSASQSVMSSSVAGSPPLTMPATMNSSQFGAHRAPVNSYSKQDSFLPVYAPVRPRLVSACA